MFYILKRWKSIEGSLDLIAGEISNTDNGSYFNEIKGSIDNLTEQTSELNKTMINIAESLRVISHNNR